MTNASDSPWANHMPQVQTEHTMSLEDFTSHVTAIYQDLHARACCPEHGARIAVAVAAACLFNKHRDNTDGVERDLTEACSAVIENVRAGFIRWTGE